MLHLNERFKALFKPREIRGAGIHFLVGPDYTAQDFQQRAIYRSDKGKPPRPPLGVPQPGRINAGQLLTSQGPLLFTQKAAIQAGFPDGVTMGQSYAQPVAGMAGRPLQFGETDNAAEYAQINA